MKRKYTFILCMALIFSAVSCEKFFDRVPENKFAANTFFASENDLILYTNGLIDTAIPGASSMALGDDVYTDFCATRSSKSFYEADKVNPGNAGGWSYSTFGFLRTVAYMLDNMENARGTMSEAKYNHYIGVGRFFRAFSTYGKVKDYGDCYYIDHVISPADSSLLYGPRQDREYVMHKVAEDLDYACKNCLTSGANIHTDGRIYINKYVALAMASRILLYEGTYRKYHAVNPSTGKPWTNEYETAEELIQLAYDYAEELVNLKAFSLVSDYRSLFVSATLPPEEVIWGRTYSTELIQNHGVTYQYCSTTSSKLYSPTKDYIMMFLSTEGKPVRGNQSVTTEFNNRDKRLTACVLGPGQKMVDASGKEVDFAPNFSWSVTGYLWMKWILPEYTPMNNSINSSYNSIPVLRYAEVLLNYAEAAAELGKMDATLWDKTIGALRKRAGVKSYYPGSAGYVKDDFLAYYYSEGLAHPANLTDVQLEIRRERATELMMEGSSRHDDLMRWNIGDLIARRYMNQGWRGIYVTAAEAKSGFKFNGKTFTVSADKKNSETNYKISTAADQSMTLSEGTYGYLVYHYALDWDDKKYLLPIPTTAINVNPKLGQNEGWQWM